MDDAQWAAWTREWDSILAGVRRIGAPAVTSELLIHPPASPAAVSELEQSGIRLPSTMSDVVMSRSSRVSFHWRLFDFEGSAEIEAPMFGPKTPMWGGCHAADSPGHLWDVGALPFLRRGYQEWLDHCFLPRLRNNPGDPDAALWLDKLPIIQIANGDMIAIDSTGTSTAGHVVYLCHDDACAIHGQVLGADFVDFMTRWSRVGCVGPEGCYLELFVEAGEFAAPGSATVLAWRSWLGMTDETRRAP